MSEYKDNQGKYRTQSLFLEYRVNGMDPPFTLKKEDQGECLSMYRIYMEIADPTEYDFALATLGSWEHWQYLAGDDSLKAWFRPHITKWRAELKNKLQSEHYKRMEHISLNGKTAGERITATKWLAAHTSPKSADKIIRGRPSHDELNARAKEELLRRQEIEEDAERISL